MRASKVPVSAVIFDFDDTLVQTKAKIHIIKNNKRIKSLTSQEYNTYKLKLDETPDFSDFNDPLLVLQAKKYKMWSTLESLYFKISNGNDSSDIYILTARTPNIVDTIYTYLKRNGIILSAENIIAVGGETPSDIAFKKKEVLTNLKNKYVSVLFYDDSPENIRLAGQIGGIDTILVD